jgi:hypothetical protein
MKTKISLIVFAVVSFLLGMFLPPYDCLQCYVDNIGGLNSASYDEKKAIEEKGDVNAYIHVRDSIIKTPNIVHCNYFYYALLMATEYNDKPANYDVYSSLKLAQSISERTNAIALYYLKRGASYGDKKCIIELAKLSARK